MNRVKVKIKDIAVVKNGSTPSTKNDEYYDGDIIWITPKDLSTQNSRYIYKGERTITEEGYKNCSAVMVPKGTVLLSSRAPIGLLSIAGTELCTNQGFKNIVPHEGMINSEFLFYLLKTKIADIEKLGSGTTFKEVSKASLEGFTISILKEIKDQQKIAAVLSALDAKIELNARINAELESMAKTLYDYWFAQFALHKSAGGKMVWNDELKREIPLGWEVGTLEQIVKIRNGFAFKSEDYQEDGRLIIRTKNFDNKTIKLDDVVYISEEKAKEYSDFELSKFDFLLVMVGASVGKSVITPSYILPALQNQNMWNFIVKEKKYKFYCNFLLSRLVEEQSKSVGGSARDFFRKDYFYSLQVTIPSDSVIEEFNKLAIPIFEKADALISESQTLTELRDWLLPMLMNGQVRVK